MFRDRTTARCAGVPTMRTVLLRSALAVTVVAFAAAPAFAPVVPPRPLLAVCFAPGTPQSTCDAVTARVALYQASAADRWSRSATNTSLLRRGDPTTLTWSVVADGTPIPGYTGEPAGNSDLRAFLDSIYGSESAWMPVLESVFARWSELSGITYVHETADDGVAIGTSSGVRGVRADIRIGGHRIDGTSNTLAYNFFPDDSDMVVDTADGYFRNTTGNSRRLRNVLGHEHGHGLGLDHVCPENETKLMEPIATTRIDGPQEDDVLAVQRLYGDPRESNDTVATATALGSVAVGASAVVTDVSIDGSTDVDVYAFSAPAGAEIDVQVVPQGTSYAEGPQNQNGTCSVGTTYDALRRVDLAVELLGANGTSQLAMSDTNPAGGAETLQAIPAAGGGVRYVRVTGSGNDDVQLYRLQIDVTPATVQPAAVADSVTTRAALPVLVDVLANDVGLTEPVTLAIETPPAHGAATVRGGSVRYAPARAFSGEDTFTYALRDALGVRLSAPVGVTVAATRYAGLADADADGDLYPDDLEAALGSDGADPVDRPVGDAPQPLATTSARTALRYARPGGDELLLRGVLPLTTGDTLEGRSVAFWIGGVLRELTLDARGRARLVTNGGGRATLRVATPTGAGASFVLRLKRDALVDAFADEGLVQERGVRNEYRELTVFVVTSGTASYVNLALRFTVRGKRGVAKLL